MAPRFKQVLVSQEADDLVNDLEGAIMRLHATDPKDRLLVENAYAAVLQRRQELFAYLSTLELNTGTHRSVAKRFE